MRSEISYEDNLLGGQPSFRSSWRWIIGSGIGAGVGASLALALFPSAAFGRNPTGQFGWHLVGFALTVGISFSIMQWLLLRNVLRCLKTANISLLILWIPVTSIGVTFMMLPLWWWDAAIFVFAPHLIVFLMLPGMLFLGLGQWFVLYRVIAARFVWVLRTVLGAAAGAVIGLYFGIAVFIVIPFLPYEAIWAFIIGGSIGLLQHFALAA
ncbi:MAG: hypothetical protein OEM98_15190, partial [Gammaproteobacteria bacterium]|nr:hypothetical protein [Gammaproteobacteria bacterium]